jgi:hypothetical protein
MAGTSALVAKSTRNLNAQVRGLGAAMLLHLCQRVYNRVCSSTTLCIYMLCALLIILTLGSEPDAVKLMRPAAA